jgi:hypothetical protein
MSAVVDKTPSFMLQLIDFSTPLAMRISIFEKIKEVLPLWENVARMRYQQLERTRPDDYAELFHDSGVMTSYGNLSQRLGAEISNFHERYAVLILQDESGCIQAIASVAKRVESLYVSTLLSAPWNTKMHGKNSPENQVKAVKGAGTALIAHICLLAHEEGKSKIELQPTDNSVTFYEDRLKMKFHEPTQCYYFDSSSIFFSAAVQSSRSYGSNLKQS